MTRFTQDLAVAAICLIAFACVAPEVVHEESAGQVQTEMETEPNFDALWDYQDVAGTEAAFRRVLKEQSAAPAGYRAQLLTQIARCRGLQREFSDAHITLDQVQGMLGDFGAPGAASDLQVAHVRYWLERGRATRSGGDAPKSEPMFLKAFELGKQIGADFHTIDAAHMLAMIGDAEGQIRWAEVALELASNSEDKRAAGWEGSLTNNLGWTMHGQDRFAEAFELFERNRAYWLERKQPRRAFIAQWSMARALRSLGRVEEALAHQRELVIEWGKEDGPSGYVYEELGECTLILVGEAEAMPHFAKAYAMLSKDDWLVAEEPERLARLAKLGGVSE